MKLKTKLKILRIVKRLLKVSDIISTVKYQQSDSIQIRTEIKVSNENLNMPETLKQYLAVKLAEDLIENGVVRFTPGIEGGDYAKGLTTFVSRMRVLLLK